jgi:hypothetical protein
VQADQALKLTRVDAQENQSYPIDSAPTVIYENMV